MSLNQHILIIDDDPEALDLLAGVLSQKGYKISTAEDGEEGLAFLESCAVVDLPDLIIMDSDIPSMDDTEFTEACRSLPRKQVQAIPVIFCSESDVTSDASMAAVSLRLQKPFNVAVMLSTVSGAFKPSQGSPSGQ